MNLSLPNELGKLIDERVRSGRYHSAQDVVAAAMANLDQQERIAQLDAAELDAIYPGIKTKLAEGLAAARAGDFVDGDEFFDQLEREERNGTGEERKTA